MAYKELLSAVEQLQGKLAVIRIRKEPLREILADIETCGHCSGSDTSTFTWSMSTLLPPAAKAYRASRRRTFSALRLGNDVAYLQATRRC